MAIPDRPSSPQSIPSNSSSRSYSPRPRRSNNRRPQSPLSSAKEPSSQRHETSPVPYKNSFKKQSLPEHSQYLGLDCEMVGSVTGESLCARAVLVDWKGRVVYDSHVAVPAEIIADYRTFVSGIVASDLIGAPSFETVRAQVLELIKGKIVVGHALENDFKCLQIDVPWYLTRDTATYRPFLQTNRFGQQMPRKLRDLALEKLGKHIQCPGQAHCPAEDARAALEIYKQHRPRWERVTEFDLCKEREQHKRQQQEMHQQQEMYIRMQHQQLLWQQQQHMMQQQQQMIMMAARQQHPQFAMQPPPAQQPVRLY